jgi:dimethylamine/trimethylamine dehydrogenase
MQRIHLVEASEDLGGHLRWVSQLPRMGEWGRIIDYRRIQLSKLDNVEVLTGLELDASAALEYGAEIVVVAAGSRWARDGLNGPAQSSIPGADAELSYVVVPEQVMVESKEVGDRVLIYDTDGYFMATALAERFALEGKSVRLMTPFAGVAPYQDLTGENMFVLPMLYQAGVEMLPGHRLSSIEDGRASGYQGIAPEQSLTWEFDSVVLVTQRIARDGLYQQLNNDPASLGVAGISALYRIGDCLAPRLQVADAIFDGHRLGREIDSDDPRVPLPYIREQRMLGATDADYDAILTQPSASSFAPSSVLGGG